MRDLVSRQNVSHLAKSLAIGFAFALSSIVMPASLAKSESRNVVAEAHATASINLRRALELATGTRFLPSDVAHQVIDVMPIDEIFWDAFELCGDGARLGDDPRSVRVDEARERRGLIEAEVRRLIDRARLELPGDRRDPELTKLPARLERDLVRAELIETVAIRALRRDPAPAEAKRDRFERVVVRRRRERE